jgi:nucleoside-diphosphate-sugar epimerase
VIGVKEKRHLPRIVASLPVLKFLYAPHIKVQFVSISNVCQAHSKAMSKLWEAPEIVGGQAYFISDGEPIGNFEYFRPLITGLGYSFPRIQMPLWILWLVVYLSNFVLNILSWISPSLTFRPFLTPCELLKTSVTHYFSVEKARVDLSYVPKEANDLRPVVRYYQQKLNKLG